MVLITARGNNSFVVTVEDGDISVKASGSSLEEATQKARFRIYCLRLDCKKVPCIVHNRNTGEIIYRNYKARTIGWEERSRGCFTYSTPFQNLVASESTIE
jgi:hypothetical protein